MIKKIIFLAASLFLIPFSCFSVPLDVSVKAEGAILINAETGAILFEKNSRQKMHPASITKIATALYALVKGPEQLDTTVTTDHDSIAWISEEAKRRSNYSQPAHWLEPGSSHIGLKKGEQLSFKDLLYGMMLASGDDASNVIAQFIGGSVPEFMKGLNEYLQELGCKDTVLYNPHGLYHPQHLTTPYDMAILTQAALKNPIFSQIVSTTRYTRPKTNKQESASWIQTNRLLRPGKFYYSKAIGVKTGYIAAAQNTLVAAAKDKDRVLIAVLMKSKDRADIFLDAARLFEAAFNQPKLEKIFVRPGPQKYQLEIKGAKDPIETYTENGLAIQYYAAEEPIVKAVLTWDQVELPIQKGQQVGKIGLFSDDGILLQAVPLLALDDAQITWLFWAKNYLSQNYIKIIVWVLLVILLGWIIKRFLR